MGDRWRHRWRLWVGNLPTTAQEGAVEKLFAASDIPVKNIDMLISSCNGHNPSYCHVDLYDANDANRAMETMQGVRLRGKAIRIRPARGKEKTIIDESYFWPMLHPWGPQAEEVDSKDDDPSASMLSGSTCYEIPTDWKTLNGEGRQVWVGGLPDFLSQDSLCDEIGRLFSSWHIEAVSSPLRSQEVRKGPHGQRYYCFVGFSSAKEAQDAVSKVNWTKARHGGHYKVRIARELTLSK